jgi:hypothetical protein
MNKIIYYNMYLLRKSTIKKITRYCNGHSSQHYYFCYKMYRYLKYSYSPKEFNKYRETFLIK